MCTEPYNVINTYKELYSIEVKQNRIQFYQMTSIIVYGVN